MITAAAAVVSLETDRLQLRTLSLADAPAIQRLASERVVAETTGLIPHPYPPDGAESFIRSLAGRKSIELAIERRSDRAVLGTIALRPLDGWPVADIGYYIGKPYWRQGYATEAARRMLEYGRVELGVRRYETCVFVGNHASARVLAKLGFAKIGEREEHFPVRGGMRRVWLFELKRPDGS